VSMNETDQSETVVRLETESSTTSANWMKFVPSVKVSSSWTQLKFASIRTED